MINIQDIIPFMKDGWVAMDSDNEWYWYEDKPFCVSCGCCDCGLFRRGK